MRISSNVLILSVVAVAAPCLAAPPLNATYVEVDYAIDSTVQIYGESWDSDDGFTVEGSFGIGEHWFLWARYSSAGYDGDIREHLVLETASLGGGFRLPIRRDDHPSEFFVTLTAEHISTTLDTELESFTDDDTGWGARAGLRASLSEVFEARVLARYQGYHGTVDGISFEVQGVIHLSDRWALTGSYCTGELDYHVLPGFEYPVEVEVDRDEIHLGVRFGF